MATYSAAPVAFRVPFTTNRVQPSGSKLYTAIGKRSTCTKSKPRINFSVNPSIARCLASTSFKVSFPQCGHAAHAIANLVISAEPRERPLKSYDSVDRRRDMDSEPLRILDAGSSELDERLILFDAFGDHAGANRFCDLYDRV